jgi:hypothetical protein
MSTAARQSIQVRFVVAAIEIASVLTTALLVAVFSGVSVWIATAVVALTWHVARGLLCGYDELYRLLRSYLFTLSRWTHKIHSRPFAVRLGSIGKTLVNPEVSSAADSLVVDSDTTPDTRRSTSIH